MNSSRAAAGRDAMQRSGIAAPSQGDATGEANRGWALCHHQCITRRGEAGFLSQPPRPAPSAPPRLPRLWAPPQPPYPALPGTYRSLFRMLMKPCPAWSGGRGRRRASAAVWARRRCEAPGPGAAGIGAPTMVFWSCRPRSSTQLWRIQMWADVALL